MEEQNEVTQHNREDCLKNQEYGKEPGVVSKSLVLNCLLIVYLGKCVHTTSSGWAFCRKECPGRKLID